jgi:hypothetical protein
MTIKPINILVEWDRYMIVSTTDTLNTLFYMSSQWWHLSKMEEDDIRDKDLWRIEQNILYYYK